MREELKMTGVMVGMVILTFAICIPIIWFRAYQESSTFNKLTGAQTTTWDALWVELRVQENTKD